MDTPNVYNQFDELPQMPYRMLVELIENNENIWKLLKHTEANALSQPNLTIAEKRELIYNGQEDERDYRVFPQLYIDESFNEKQSQLRIEVGEIRPDNYIYGQVNFSLMVIAHNSMSVLDNYENRTTRMMQEVIKTLNGKEINGIGKLSFNRMRHESVLAKKIKINKWFSGYIFFMSVIT